jgi:cell division protein FtsZ
MISYDRDPQQTIPESSVKIIGLGGAGANMLDRAALDGMTGAEMLCINTDMRTLSSSVAGEKIQIGKNLTKGLGAGGDPELGLRAAQESETEIYDAVRGRKMIFLCVGLGGGTGSGAAPLISRIAREEGAFVVVFATMPFGFEGQRRRDQAETTLNELAVLANALVTFDNGRMGELVLAKQGIHEAFAAADRMISESIKAVTRLVVRPGLINVGLDDLMSALRTTRSRCLFGSGIADGENRSQVALENALTSPLLDKGSLLEDAATVLVHICGGESMTLYEVELLMQGLLKYVPDSAHVLFGAAVDPEMGDALSVTLVSALPEEKLKPLEAIRQDPVNEPELSQEPEPEEKDEEEIVEVSTITNHTVISSPEDEQMMEPSEGFGLSDDENIEDYTPSAAEPEPEKSEEDIDDLPDIDRDEQSFFSRLNKTHSTAKETHSEEVIEEPELTILDNDPEESDQTTEFITPVVEKSPQPQKKHEMSISQPELELDGGPKGKFEGGSPNIHEGEDLDVPAFLRKRKK